MTTEMAKVLNCYNRLLRRYQMTMYSYDDLHEALVELVTSEDKDLSEIPRGLKLDENDPF